MQDQQRRKLINLHCVQDQQRRKPVTIDASKLDFNQGDAAMLNVGADVAAVAGLGFGFQAVKINKGDDKGFHFFYSVNTNVGVDLSAGVSFGKIDFNEKSGLQFNRNTFEGWSQGWSGGAGWASGQTITSFADGDYHPPFSGSKISYSGVLGGVSTIPVKGIKLGATAKYYYSYSYLIKGWSISTK